MTQPPNLTPASLSSLIGSRICHDLISPIGAITNGLELLEMAGAPSGPELSLIGESVENAGARIRFFRVAFGLSGSEALSAAEVTTILRDLDKAGRIRLHWMAAGAVARSDARLAFLAILCLETALAYGGDITVTHDGGQWHVQAKAERLLYDEALWAGLLADAPAAPITPALVQFALLPLVAGENGRAMDIDATATEISIRF